MAGFKSGGQQTVASTDQFEWCNERVNQHEERIRSLEISRAKFMGAILAMSTFGSVLGSIIFFVITKLWK